MAELLATMAAVLWSSSAPPVFESVLPLPSTTDCTKSCRRTRSELENDDALLIESDDEPAKSASPLVSVNCAPLRTLTMTDVSAESAMLPVPVAKVAELAPSSVSLAVEVSARLAFVPENCMAAVELSTMAAVPVSDSGVPVKCNSVEASVSCTSELEPTANVLLLSALSCAPVASVRLPVTVAAELAVTVMVAPEVIESVLEACVSESVAPVSNCAEAWLLNATDTAPVPSNSLAAPVTRTHEPEPVTVKVDEVSSASLMPAPIVRHEPAETESTDEPETESGDTVGENVTPLENASDDEPESETPLVALGTSVAELVKFACAEPLSVSEMPLPRSIAVPEPEAERLAVPESARFEPWMRLSVEPPVSDSDELSCSVSAAAGAVALM